MKSRDEIGTIACPRCKREARVLQFAERTRVDPAQDGGRTYPRKLYIDCPHPDAEGERCGVTRMDSKAGQAWILEHAHVAGAKSARSSSSSSSSKPPPAAARESAAGSPTPPVRTAPDPPPAPAKKKSWMDGLI